MVWYGMIWYGMIVYNMVWYGIIRYGKGVISIVDIKDGSRDRKHLGATTHGGDRRHAAHTRGGYRGNSQLFFYDY